MRKPQTRIRAWLEPAPEYRLVRVLLLSLLGLIYLFAFLGLLLQGDALLGSQGLTPIARFEQVLSANDVSFWEAPSLFRFVATDSFMRSCAWAGALLSLLVVTGHANAPVLLLLWLLYGSFVHMGQLWFAFGWELQLLETGFIALFFAPLLDLRPFRAAPPPRITLALFRWLIFRIMLGAGLIKLRGDACWTDLTCLDFHFETQPIPNPLSPFLHHLPHWLLAGGVLFNHLVELVLPWFVFGPRRLRLWAGAIMLLFQLTLIVSGNLAFLNWLTLVPIVACFDDAALLAFVPVRVRSLLTQRLAQPVHARGLGQGVAAGLFALLVAWLSIPVVTNLVSSRQAMNRGFDPLSLVNTYGAFGSVGDVRHELIIEGTADEQLHARTRWQAYELPCKPGAVTRRPCVLGPYHLRLDWLIWFAAMEEQGERVPWMVHVVYKLLEGDPQIKSLLAHDPFPQRPPRHVRVRRFVYRFASPSSDAWWVRDQEQLWLPPLSADTPGVRAYLEAHGLLPHTR